MNRLRLLFVSAGLLVFAGLFAQPVLATILTQKAQIGITIIVNVLPSPTPTPVAYLPQQELPGQSAPKIIAKLSLRGAPPALQRAFRAESLNFVGSSKVIAQAQVQHGVLVQAEVTPNPTATILTSTSLPNQGGNSVGSVTLNQTAGTTVVWPCAFYVNVDLVAAWQIQEGLSNDFSADFPGKDLANNTYVGATPEPTATPYAVYADDKSVWTALGSGNSATSYCVTLTLTIPGGVSAGPYSTNAVYTLFGG